MLWIVMVPTIVFSNIASSWAYLYPDDFQKHFSQEQLIVWWISINIINLSLFLILCLQAKVRPQALLIGIPFILLGIFLIGYSYFKLGPIRTFFGYEMGKVNDMKIQSFPFNLGHVQYKGFIILLFGLWFSCNHTHELTAITGFWIVSFLVQMWVETCESHGSATQAPTPWSQNKHIFFKYAHVFDRYQLKTT